MLVPDLEWRPTISAFRVKLNSFSSSIQHFVLYQIWMFLAITMIWVRAWKWELALIVYFEGRCYPHPKSWANFSGNTVPGWLFSGIFKNISLFRNTGEWSFMSCINNSYQKIALGFPGTLGKCSTQGSSRPHMSSRSSSPSKANLSLTVSNKRCFSSSQTTRADREWLTIPR